VTNNAIRDNTASTEHDGYGGGLFLTDTSAAIRDNSISGNVATESGSSYGHGGGLNLWQSDATLSRNTIRGNVASSGQFGHGGGLSLSESEDQLVNNAIIDNQAGGMGAGLYADGGTPTLIHATIARNTGGDASGIYLTLDGTLTLRNSILASQSTGIIAAGNSTASVDGILWYANTTNSGGDGTVDVSHATTGNPAFMPDGYHILAGSAAKDAGIDAKIGDDIDGETRPYQIADLGADEYWPPETPSWTIFLPLTLNGSR
jgi:hypothetical protein